MLVRTVRSALPFFAICVTVYATPVEPAYFSPLPPTSGAPHTSDAPPPSKPPPVLRQLTHAQYNNTVRDLLGDDTRLADQFPPEDFINGFKNQFQGQSISPLLAESYSGAA